MGTGPGIPRKEPFMTSSFSSRRTIAVLVLAAVLLAPSAAGAAPRALPANRAVTGALGDLLARFWSSIIALWGDGGCSADPSGRCDTHVTTPPITPDGGCSVDPSGGCAGGS
jgi:hypothetical protein